MTESSSKPTMSEVAEAAGVSNATVSRVLNDRAGVAESTRRHVLSFVEKLDYKKPLRREGHCQDGNGYVTIIAHAADNEYIGTIMRGILDQLELSAHRAVLHLTEADPALEVEYVRSACQANSGGVLIVTPLASSNKLFDPVTSKLPHVLIDSYPDSSDVPCVRSSNWQGAREATKYLISLGHRRIGFVAGRRGDHITEEREHGYRSALLEADLPFPSELVRDGDYGRESGYVAGCELLELQDRPTAIFASSDMMAWGVMEAAYVGGLRIPDDLSVVGFDDLPLASNLHPALTTVRQSLYDMGRMATQMVVTLMADRELVSNQIELPTQLVIRHSCRALNER